MKHNILFCILIYNTIFDHNNCDSYKILGIFPSDGRSHHIIFSSFVEELAIRNHDVTVINYFPVKQMPNLHQISIQSHKQNEYNNIDMNENLNSIPDSLFVDFYRAYDMAVTFKEMGDDNCEKLMTNPKIKKLISDGDKYDLVISEQFVTDCGLAIAFKLNAPVIGMTAHTLMPWTYSRLGAPNNPSYVPNHLFASTSSPTLWQKIKSVIINVGMSTYYRYSIQKSNQEIVNKVYPEVPDLEALGNNISLVLVNQYFPLTGSRIQGANVIEVGGMHVKHQEINDKELQDFLDKSGKSVVYISFGTVAHHFPSDILKEIMDFIKNTKNLMFVWKVDNVTESVPPNLLLRKWVSQQAILCHPKVVAFVSHSGMLSTTEAVHCGVPLIAVPLFGDQFSNAAAASEKGLAVVLNIYTLNSQTLEDALSTVLQDRYQSRSKEFSVLWKDRPLSPMDTAVHWAEYVARHKGRVEARPATISLNVINYFMIDVLLIFLATSMLIIYSVVGLFRAVIICTPKKINSKTYKRKNQ